VSDVNIDYHQRDTHTYRERGGGGKRDKRKKGERKRREKLSREVFPKQSKKDAHTV